MKRHITDSLTRLRAESPLVHHITNWVTISACADLAKSFGASPVMAHAVEEVAEMAGSAGALVLNIGTLTKAIVDSMLLAARSANAKGIPVILDVCGAGATPFRDQTCERLLSEARIDVIKGNASEIARVAGLEVLTKGVDSTEIKENLSKLALTLARQRKAVVVVTGSTDIVASPDGRIFLVDNGCPLMAKVVGTGCMAATAMGCFAALGGNLTNAVIAGLVCYETAAEIAAENCAGPGSFLSALMDSASNLDVKTVCARMRVRTVS